LTPEFQRSIAVDVGRELALVIVAVIIFTATIGVATAYPSHAYQTATPISSVHTYCSTVGAFEGVSTRWKVDRRWPMRAGALGAGLVLGLGSLAAARVSYTRRQRSA
jgi:hypothetical protein